MALIHVKSLLLSTPGNKRYLFNAGTMSVNAVVRKIREEYPQLRERVLEGGGGDGFPVPMAKCDTSRSDEVFGTEWKGWWESAKATVDDILEYERGHAVA